MPGPLSVGRFILWDKDCNSQVSGRGQRLMEFAEFVSGHTEVGNGPGI